MNTQKKIGAALAVGTPVAMMTYATYSYMRGPRLLGSGMVKRDDGTTVTLEAPEHNPTLAGWTKKMADIPVVLVTPAVYGYPNPFAVAFLGGVALYLTAGD